MGINLKFETVIKWKVALLILYGFILGLAHGQSCTNLYAADYSQTFDSHFWYGLTDYSTHESSCWIIQADYGQVVYLESESFDLEDNCYSAYTGDRVNIYDGDSDSSPLDLTVCGTSGVHAHQTTGRYAYVEFKTDESIENSGFRMSYKNADTHGQSCTNLYAADYSQTFDSHFWYGLTDYSTHESSCWIIQADYGQVVYLESESFDLEDNCYSAYTGDRVNIYDGDSDSSPLDLTVCGTSGVNAHKTTGRYAYVEFKTDESIENSGFRMSYKNADSDEEDTSGWSIAVIVGIVIGSLVGLAVIVGLIIFCVVVANTKKRGGKVHSTTGPVVHTIHTNQAYYPQQQQQQRYGNPGYGGGRGAMVVNQAPPHYQNNPPPAAPPPSHHPVDPRGVPMPALYKEP